MKLKRLEVRKATEEETDVRRGINFKFGGFNESYMGETRRGINLGLLNIENYRLNGISIAIANGAKKCEGIAIDFLKDTGSFEGIGVSVFGQDSKFSQGIRLSGIANLGNRGVGISIAGIANHHSTDQKNEETLLKGVNIAGLWNYSTHHLSGLNMSCANCATSSISGISAAATINGSLDLDTNIQGLSVAGLSNAGLNLSGISVSGVVNIGIEKISGISVTSLVNCGEEINGLVISAFNISRNFKGVSLGAMNVITQTAKGIFVGAINVAKELTGAVIGLINWNQKVKGLQVGLFNMLHESEGTTQIGLINMRTDVPWYLMLIPLVAIRLGNSGKRLFDKLVKNTKILDEVKKTTREKIVDLMGKRPVESDGYRDASGLPDQSEIDTFLKDRELDNLFGDQNPSLVRVRVIADPDLFPAELRRQAMVELEELFRSDPVKAAETISELRQLIGRRNPSGG
ncbi:hypothetical protein HY990_04855 [Candidatus Micrarchaeota archaeon]|nr:hypothetical protein [Candidatus Micrarchaeota archaeon]